MHDRHTLRPKEEDERNMSVRGTAITVRSGENWPIPGDTAGEYGGIYGEHQGWTSMAKNPDDVLLRAEHSPLPTFPALPSSERTSLMLLWNIYCSLPNLQKYTAQYVNTACL